MVHHSTGLKFVTAVECLLKHFHFSIDLVKEEELYLQLQSRIDCLAQTKLNLSPEHVDTTRSFTFLHRSRVFANSDLNFSPLLNRTDTKQAEYHQNERNFAFLPVALAQVYKWIS